MYGLIKLTLKKLSIVISEKASYCDTTIQTVFG